MEQKPTGDLVKVLGVTPEQLEAWQARMERRRGEEEQEERKRREHRGQLIPR